MTIVVTGATGHLGRLIVASLLARGVEPGDVVALGRNTERLEQLASQGVRTAAVDYADTDGLAAAMQGADALMLISGSEPGHRVEQHRNAVDAARAAGVTRIVYTSATKADSTPLILAPEHKETEELLKASSADVTVLRNNWYTENYAGSVEQAAATREYRASTGDGRVASATRAEYAEAAAIVLTSDGHAGATYELGGATAWNGDDMAAALTALVGSEVRYIALSPEEHQAALSAAGLDEGTAGFVVALDGNIRDGALDVTTGDLSRLLGRPTATLLEGLRLTTGG